MRNMVGNVVNVIITTLVSTLIIGTSSQASETPKTPVPFNQYTDYSRSIEGFPGIRFGPNLVPIVEDQYWLPPQSKNNGSTQTMLSKDQNYRVSLTYRENEEDDLVTWKKNPDGTENGALTVYRDRAIMSHTYSFKGNAITVTREVCNLLKSQSNAKTMSDFVEKAQTCESFYKRSDVPSLLKNAMGDYDNIHKSNVALLRRSIAKTAIKEKQAVKAEPSSSLTNLVNAFKFGKESESGKVTPDPRKLAESLDLFSLKSTSEDVNFRAAISSIARTCEKFYPDSAAKISTASPATSIKATSK